MIDYEGTPACRLIMNIAYLVVVCTCLLCCSLHLFAFRSVYRKESGSFWGGIGHGCLQFLGCSQKQGYIPLGQGWTSCLYLCFGFHGAVLIPLVRVWVVRMKLVLGKAASTHRGGKAASTHRGRHNTHGRFPRHYRTDTGGDISFVRGDAHKGRNLVPCSLHCGVPTSPCSCPEPSLSVPTPPREGRRRAAGGWQQLAVVGIE